MDIRPYYTDPIGQTAVKPMPSRAVAWAPLQIDGLMRTQPFVGIGKDWSGHGRAKGEVTELVPQAGAVELQVQ